MKANGLGSNYTVAQYKHHVNKCNESKAINELNRAFNTDEPYAAVVSNFMPICLNISVIFAAPYIWFDSL